MLCCWRFNLIVISYLTSFTQLSDHFRWETNYQLMNKRLTKNWCLFLPSLFNKRLNCSQITTKYQSFDSNHGFILLLKLPSSYFIMIVLMILSKKNYNHYHLHCLCDLNIYHFPSVQSPLNFEITEWKEKKFPFPFENSVEVWIELLNVNLNCLNFVLV